MRRCACGNEAHRKSCGDWVCKRCYDSEHQWVEARSLERKYEGVANPRTVRRLRTWSCRAYWEVQIGAAGFWARRGLPEPVETFNAVQGGAS